MPTKTFFRLPKEKRQRIIDAAAEEFLAYEDQYEKASVKRIAAGAGIPVGSFYQYFESKDDLFFYVYDINWTDTVPEIEEETLATYLQKRLQRVSEQEKHSPFYRIVEKNKEQLLTPMYFDRTFNSAVMERVRGIAEADLRKGLLREGMNPELIAYMYMAIDWLEFQYSKDHETAEEDEKIIEAFADMLFHGIYKA